MWQQYRKTVVPMQVFIAAYFLMGRLWVVVLFIFAIMELGALAGAAGSARLQRKMRAAEERLPLQRRR